MIAGLEPNNGSQIIDNLRGRIVYLPQQQPNLDDNRTVNAMTKAFAYLRLKVFKLFRVRSFSYGYSVFMD